MKKLSRILIAVGFAVLAACTIASEVRLEKPEPTLFEIACTELAVDCTGIKPPTVIYSQIPKAYGALGLYFHGEPYIYVNTYYTRVPWDQIVLHETVHYVMYETGQLDSTQNSGCDSEEKARVITARVFNQEVDPTWRKGYGCPAPL